jgi:hypothetical protein
VPGSTLARASDVVRATYGIERSGLSRRGSRHPACATLAYLARRRTAATNAELMAALGLSRPESVPNLTRRFGPWLASTNLRHGIGPRRPPPPGEPANPGPPPADQRPRRGTSRQG